MMPAAKHYVPGTGKAGILSRPEVCADVGLALRLNALQPQPNLQYDTQLTTGGLLCLLRLGMTEGGRLLRDDVAGHSSRQRCTGEDMRELARRGWIADRGAKMVEITDEGNAAVRRLLAFAQAMEGGGK